MSAVLLTLTLLLCGGYAGMALMCQIGVLPTMRQLSPKAYAEAWRIMDGYMDRSMPPFKISLLVLTAATFVSVALEHRFWLAGGTAVSFLLTLAALVLTVRKLLPLNAQVRNWTPGSSEDSLRLLRDQIAQNFSVRFWLAAASFVVLCGGAIFWPVR